MLDDVWTALNENAIAYALCVIVHQTVIIFV